MTHFHLHYTLVILLISSTSLIIPCLAIKQPIWLKPYIIDYRNGTIVRDTITEHPSFVPPPNNTLIQSKDIAIPSSSRTHSLRIRVFLPTRPDPTRKLPIIIYFHGGAFCIGSAFSFSDTLFVARLTARANLIALAVDYRLYPESIVPDPYDDAWTALLWLVSHKHGGPGSDPWLARYGDFNRIYTGGDSAGGNIAHNLAIHAGLNRIKLKGVILAMPYFLGSSRVPSEPESITQSPNYKVWSYVCPKCKGGVDNGYINPFGPGAPNLSGLGCGKLLVYIAELDELKGRGRLYYEKVMRSGWKGKAQLIEAQGKSHVFHILQPDDPATTTLIQDFSLFINA